MARKHTDFIVVHCSATPPSMDIGAAEIDRWHRARGWLKIGYHYVIRRDGTVEVGRNLFEPGAHASGYNGKSIGICMVGGSEEGNVSAPQNNFAPAQFDALADTIVASLVLFPDAEVIGHNEISAKACPSFDVKAWLGHRNATAAPPQAHCPECGRAF